MKKMLKIMFIVLFSVILFLALDTFQAKFLNHSPFLKLRKTLNETTYVDEGLLVNHFHCDTKEEKTLWKDVKYTCPLSEANDLPEGIYKILDFMGKTIYADEEDPKFIDNGTEVSIKEFLPQSNCTISCLYHNSEPIEILRDGGTKIYQFQNHETTYYLVECNKINSQNHDIFIGKEKEKLIKLC